MSTCDICGQHTKKDLFQLTTNLQIPGVTHVCKDCGDWAEDMKNAAVLDFDKRLKDAIYEKKHGKPKQRFSLWNFLLMR